jgi:hypothetical protein
MKRIGSIVTCLLIAILVIPAVRADEPAAQELSAEQKAVVEAFIVYNEAMNAFDDKAMAERQHAVTDSEKSLSAAMIRGDVAVARLKAAVGESFGGEAAVRRMAMVMNDITNDEAPHATVEFRGEDRAILGFKAPSRAAGQSIPMIRVDGVWKFDITQPPEAQEQLTAQAGRLDARTAQVLDLVGAVKARAYDSISDVVEEINKRGL